MPVQQYPPPTPAPTETATQKPRSNRIIILTAGLIGILVLASVAAALLFIPTTSWSFEKTFSDGSPDIDSLNLNFATNIGQINIMTLEVGEKAVLIHVQGNGSSSFITNDDMPMTVTFDNQTIGRTLTINSQINVENALTRGADVSVQIYVDPKLHLNLNVTSTTGKISLTADRGVTIEALLLQTTTGDVEANLQDKAALNGPVILRTTTGEVNLRIHEIGVLGNCTLDLQTVTGNIAMDITETSQFDGNMEVNAAATMGTIYLGLEVDAGVAAKVTSATNMGSIETNLVGFTGDQSPLYSSNYPSESNIDITNTVHGTGNININAKTQTVTIAH
jgi:hypothetical protein